MYVKDYNEYYKRNIYAFNLKVSTMMKIFWLNKI